MLPEPFDETIWWVKADMIATVSLERLDLFRTGRDQYGRRKYLTNLKVSEGQFGDILTAVRHALGLSIDKSDFEGHIPRDCSQETVEPQDPLRGGRASGDDKLGAVSI